MSPSLRRYIHNEQDICALLWRFIPKAMKDLKVNGPKRVKVEYGGVCKFRPTVKSV